jgi:murein DD-endopeptidase MepM/ murein hydrolase activator NlpD
MGTIASAILGGTASHLGGGKFANGAVTAAFGYVMNQISQSQSRLRWVFAVDEGVVERVGWENPNDQSGPKSGFGFRISLRIEGGYLDIYAHMDPSTVSLSVGDSVRAGEYIGMYADPKNGTASGPHLHFERRDKAGNSVPVDWKTVTPPIPEGIITSDYGRRFHPVHRTWKLHGGTDWIGPTYP